MQPSRQSRGPDIKTKIAIIACQWHPLTAVENAAKDGLSYAADIVITPVKCSGVVTVSMILKLFAKGLEGVLVMGCGEGDCHYFNGSDRCAEIVEEARKILDITGIPGKRLGYFLLSESQGRQFEKNLKAYLKQFKTAGAGRKVAAAGRK